MPACGRGRPASGSRQPELGCGPSELLNHDSGWFGSPGFSPQVRQGANAWTAGPWSQNLWTRALSRKISDFAKALTLSC